MATDVAVTLIRKDDQFLLVYNENWGAYTLPMTRRKKPASAGKAGKKEAEDWLDAAARPVVECLGRLSQDAEEVADIIPKKHFSQRREEHAMYRYKVFQVDFQENDQITAGTPTAWLTAEQIEKRELRPISPTAREIIINLGINDVVTES